MTSYRVFWNADVEANTPGEAASKALKKIRDLGEVVHLEVVDTVNLDSPPVTVDLINFDN